MSDVEDRVAQEPEVGEVALELLQARLDPSAAVPDLQERSLEQVGAAVPFVPLLHALQDRVGVDHRPRERGPWRIKLSAERRGPPAPL